LPNPVSLPFFLFSKTEFLFFQTLHCVLVGNMGDKRAQDEMMLLLGKTPPRGFEAPLVDGTAKV
jgi:hypothetical protein